MPRVSLRKKEMKQHTRLMIPNRSMNHTGSKLEITGAIMPPVRPNILLNPNAVPRTAVGKSYVVHSITSWKAEPTPSFPNITNI